MTLFLFVLIDICLYNFFRAAENNQVFHSTEQLVHDPFSVLIFPINIEQFWPNTNSNNTQTQIQTIQKHKSKQYTNTNQNNIQTQIQNNTNLIKIQTQTQIIVPLTKYNSNSDNELLAVQIKIKKTSPFLSIMKSWNLRVLFLLYSVY